MYIYIYANDIFIYLYKFIKTINSPLPLRCFAVF
uniref:Uncharacterized protein n=1 Tax=viral metagenome TaxID=1070528 RepID=A0A6C0K8V5_9ZZZZ